MTAGIHLSAPFINREVANSGVKCAFKHTEQAGSEPLKWNHSVVVAKTLHHTQAEGIVTSADFVDLLHGVRNIYFPDKVGKKQV